MLKGSKRSMLSWSFASPMSLRFDHDPDATDDVIEEAETAKDAEIAKAKQMAEQEAANARRAKEQATQANERLEQLETENEANRQKLAELEAKAAETGVDVPDLDESQYQDGDVPLVKAIKALNAKIDAKDKRIAELEQAGKDREKTEAEVAAQRQRDASYNSLLDDLDGEYGAQYRNAAINAFNALVAEGKVPKDATKATLALTRCYKQAEKAAKSNKGSDTTLDTGSGGGGNPSLTRTKLKKGSLAEVEAQLANTG